MAFQSYDQYIQNFGAALQGAAQPTPITPQGGAFAPPPEGPPAPPPQPPQDAAGAFGPAPAAAGGPEVPAAPAGPFTQQGALSGQPSPAPAAPPSGGFTTPQPVAQKPAGGFTPAPEQQGEDGLSMKKLFDDSPEKDREALAKELEPQLGGDLIKAAEAAEELDPTLAEKWGIGEWTRHEAAAFLMEFGLRMMQASGSGQGNVFSDIGGSALETIDSRRAFKKDADEKLIKDEDRAHELEKRERDKKKWGAEDREETRDRKRKAAEELRRGEAHEMNQRLSEMNLEGAPQMTINENNEVVFSYPGSQKRWNTGIKASERDAHGRISAFAEQHDAWRKTAAGLNDMQWSDMTPKQQAIIDNAYFEYQKTGVNTKGARAKFIAEWVSDAVSELPGSTKRNPAAVAAVREEARAAAEAMARSPSLFGPEEQTTGGIPIFDKEGQPPPNATPEEATQFYLDLARHRAQQNQPKDD